MAATPPARGLPAAKALLERTRVSGWAFDVEWAVGARARGLSVMEIPVRWSHQGDDKVRVDRAVLASLLDLARVCRRLRRVGYGAS